MALPSTGPISMAMVASELGIGTTGVNLNQTNVRTLAAKASGAVALADLRGKSGVSSLTASVSPTEINDWQYVVSSGSKGYPMTASVSGGVTPYSYVWTTNVGTLSGTGASRTLTLTHTGFGGYYSGEVRCEVTDNAGTKRTIVIPVTVEFYGDGGIYW